MCAISSLIRRRALRREYRRLIAGRVAASRYDTWVD